jgi:hypothetical protein
MTFESGVGRAVVLIALATGTWLGVGPWRAWCVAHARTVLVAIVALDALLLLWATTPSVVTGFDESQFLIAAHCLRGADLDVPWIRTPLPVLAIAAMPLHATVPGIVAKQLATLVTFLLVSRPLGVGWALFAALLVSSAEEMVGGSCEAVSEPYGAAALIAFALAVVRGGPIAMFATATLGALSRWQLLWLLPLAALVTWRRRGWRHALVLGVLAAACVAGCVWLTGVDPWRALLQERQREHTLFERIVAYVSPKVGLGLGPLGMLVAVVGAVALVRERPRCGLLPVAVLFGIYFAGVVGIGVITPRFLGPAVPLGCVLIARGAVSIVARWPQLATGWRASLAAAVLVVVAAIPVHAPRMRERKLTSPQAPLALARDAVLAALGDAILYSDVDCLRVRAILARRCVAVGSAARHEETTDGRVDREHVPAGSFYLTFDPAGRPPLWANGGLALVRW